MSGTDVATATVVASAGWLAEAHATAAVLAGTGGAIEHLLAHRLAGVIIGGGGAIHRVGAPTPRTPQAPRGRRGRRDRSGVALGEPLREGR